MKIFKKMIAALLVMITFLLSAPLSGFADLDSGLTNMFSLNSLAATDTGKCGKKAKWKYDKATKTLTVYGEGDMYDYNAYNGNYSPYYDKEKYPIENVVVKDGITRIGDEAFSYVFENSDIKTVKIADSVTAIGKNAFYGAAIEKIKFPKKLKRIGEWAFSGCYNLTKIVIPDTVTVIGESAFWGCDSLKEFDTGDGVVKLNNVLVNCTNLTKIVLGKSVKSFKYDYYICGNILCPIFVDKSNKYYSSDKNGIVFNKDKTKLLFYPGKLKLKTYTIPKTVKAVSAYAFYDVSYLEKVDASHVEKIGMYAFSSGDIKQIVLGEGLTTLYEGAFSYSDKLKELKLPASVTKIGVDAFAHSAPVFVDSNNKHYSSDEAGVLFNKNKTTLIHYSDKLKAKSYKIPETVTEIAERAFESNQYITDVEFPAALTKIEKYAFSDCEKLQSVSLGKNLKYIGELAFDDCRCLEKLYIEEGSTAEINDEAFLMCYSLRDISVSGKVFKIGRYAFYSTGFEMDLEERNYSGPYYVGKVLCGVIGDPDKISIKEGTVGIAEEAFSCLKVKSVTIPSSLEYIGENAFIFTENLKKITLSKDNKHFVIYEDALFNSTKTRLIKYASDSSAKEYVAPKTVKNIYDYAFCSGNNLEKIELSSNVENINIRMFVGTKLLENFPEDEVIYYKKHAIGFIEVKYYPSIIVLKDGTKSTSVGELTDLGFIAMYIPKSVKEISCLPEEVYYEGSEEDWKKIKFSEEMKEHLNYVKVHYNFNKKNHTHKYYEGTRLPEKCFSPMLNTYTCPCGKSYVKEGIMFDEHFYCEKVNVTKKATEKNSGVKYLVCESCGKNFNKMTIDKIASVKLSYKNTKYNGKVKKPEVIATDSNGYELYEGTDYTVKYQSGRKEVGTYTVTVTFKGDYSGTKKLKFNIVSP